MKLTDALGINQAARKREAAAPLRVALCCGFTSLQLGQFLSAHLHSRHRDRIVEPIPMPFGDALGCLDLVEADCDVAFLITEWQDFDPRLGIRQIDRRPSLATDILDTVRLRLEILRDKVANAARHTTVHISLPHFPTPTVLPSPAGRRDSFAIELEALIIESARALVGIPGVYVLTNEDPGAVSDAYDIKGDMRFGCPYSIAFQGAVTRRLAKSSFPDHPPLKGLITDLDDTLWRGIIGEAGVDSVSWSLDEGSHLHAVYQQQLRALAEQGVLLATASKNDPAIAGAGLTRPDIIAGDGEFFPHEIHWGPKSESVTRILKTWNISADSVLFIDDSPGELAEVETLHPEIHTRRFPTGDDAATLALIQELGELFSKGRISEEDQLRAASIRISSEVTQQPHTDPEAFLRQCQAHAHFDLSLVDDPRAFELVNKTNQFNLNGVRLSPADWIDRRSRNGALMMTARYEDKFGKLGKVAVLTGIRRDRELEIDSWVLSCRAFSRRLEHLCLHALFKELDLEQLSFRFRRTDRNDPVARFLTDYAGDPLPEDIVLDRKSFLDRCPSLYHSLEFKHDD